MAPGEVGEIQLSVGGGGRGETGFVSENCIWREVGEWVRE